MQINFTVHAGILNIQLAGYPAELWNTIVQHQRDQSSLISQVHEKTSPPSPLED
jgi:hypothetical protein